MNRLIDRRLSCPPVAAVVVPGTKIRMNARRQELRWLMIPKRKILLCIQSCSVRVRGDE